MRLAVLSAAVVACGGVVSAAPASSMAPALPLSAFNHSMVTPLTLDEILNGGSHDPAPEAVSEAPLAASATCSNPRIRVEWDSYSNADRAAYISAIRCLMGRPPSGAFSQSRSRYEDFVSLHQNLTPNVHGNSKFLIWHRYFLWAFEDVLRTECGFAGSIPWFDETRYAGHFSTSSIFSSSYYGGIALGGGCVTTGAFAGLTLNVGPGPSNTVHCLARNGDGSKTANCNSASVNGCNARTDYADMAACAEGAAHAWGHNGIGAVMADVYASPGDPVFWLHHAFVDRNFRIWQNADPARITYIDGHDAFGNALTLDTMVLIGNIRPNIAIRDIINTLGTALCYRYNY